MAKKLFAGIIPALYTCFSNDGTVNYSETTRLAKWLAGKGAAGFYLCGTTGNGLLLSKEERKTIAEAVSDTLGGTLPLMIHVGCMTTSDAIELAQHAASLSGVRAISSLPPQYYTMPLRDEISNLSAIASATDLPFYPYLFGSMVEECGVEALIDAFAQIPNMAGIKAFIADLSILQRLVKLGPAHWELLHGFDQCLFQALCIAGVSGAIGSTYNIVPEIAVAIYRATVERDFEKAISLQERFSSYWISIQGNNFLTFGRYFLEKRGFKMGSPRLPLCAPTSQAIRQVEHKMKLYGFNVLTGGL